MESTAVSTKPETSKKLKYNVIYPTGTEQEYFPMLELGSVGGHPITEIDAVNLTLKRNRDAKKRHVTAFFFLSPPGLGKTTLGAHLARIYNCPYQILNCVSNMTDLDLLGSPLLMGAETVWQDGPIPSVIRAANDHANDHPDAILNGVLIVNELNALTQSAQLAFNPVLDRQECVVLTQNNNEQVKVNANAQLLVIASMNPDVMGVNELQEAVRDRAIGIIYMDYPSASKESELVGRITGYPASAVLPFCEVIESCRALKTVDRKITIAPSTRGLLDWIDLTETLGAKVAYDMTIVNRYGTTVEERKLLESQGRSKDIVKFSLGLATKVTAVPKKKSASTTTKAASPASADWARDLGDLWGGK